MTTKYQYAEMVRTKNTIYWQGDEWPDISVSLPRRKLADYSHANWRKYLKIAGELGWQMITSETIDDETYFYFCRIISPVKKTKKK